tara:strand:- start:655 stop:861 length:207 start_codon:yes stop_codon:yes gene_type:complete
VIISTILGLDPKGNSLQNRFNIPGKRDKKIRNDVLGVMNVCLNLSWWLNKHIKTCLDYAQAQKHHLAV